MQTNGSYVSTIDKIMSILLTLLLTCSAVVATIHEDRHQAFRPAGQRLPEELGDQIWNFYPKVTYGDNPNSPILSLEETQALFPPLHLDNEWEDEKSVWYKSDLLNQTMVEDRYLTLYVTESTDRDNQDFLGLYFEGDSNCPMEIRYFVANEKVQQWSRGYRWPYLFLYHTYTYDFSISKAKMDREQEPGTEILLYIPQGCTLTLLQVSRVIAKQHFNLEAEGIPENISWST